jgi:hypothetical protein
MLLAVMTSNRTALVRRFSTLARRGKIRYGHPMTQAVAQILHEVEQLSISERAELADCLVESLVRKIPSKIEQAQIEEVRRRISQVDSGDVGLIPGEQALQQVRRLVAAARKAS